MFDLSGANPILGEVILIPEAQKDAAYTPQTEEEQESEDVVRYQGEEFGIDLPAGWITSTVGSQVNLQPPDQAVAISLAPWGSDSPPADGQSFFSWIDATWPDIYPQYESLSDANPIWAKSGQAGYLITWNLRRQDGALEESEPIALFEANRPDFYALGINLLATGDEENEAFQSILPTLSIEQIAGLPADMNVYRHDGLGYRIQFPADWTLLPSPLGAAFQAPDQGVTVSVGPWPMLDGPTADQPFDAWVADAPTSVLQGYGDVSQMTPVETTAGDTGYLTTWQVTLNNGQDEVSDPIAVFEFRRQYEGASYHALAVNLHVPTETVTFDRMVATLVIESQDTADMVFIPAGAFIRGSSNEEITAWKNECGSSCRQNEFDDEAPQRLITLDAYYIDRTEVTVSQFKEFVEATGYRSTSEQKGDAIEYTWRAFDSPDRQNHPVRWMSWDDANAYCQWAGKRLPTESRVGKGGPRRGRPHFSVGATNGKRRTFLTAIPSRWTAWRVAQAPTVCSGWLGTSGNGWQTITTLSIMARLLKRIPRGRYRARIGFCAAAALTTTVTLCAERIAIMAAPRAMLSTTGFRCAADG